MSKKGEAVREVLIRISMCEQQGRDVKRHLEKENFLT